MARKTDIRPIGARLYFIPVTARVPLKFGTETMTTVTCARVCLQVKGRDGRVAEGWGETPLSVQWVWPGNLPYEHRHTALKTFCQLLADVWPKFDSCGHPIEVGHDFLENELSSCLKKLNRKNSGAEPSPVLAALFCLSAFDMALHDAFGQLHGVGIYETYHRDFMSRNLAEFLMPARKSRVDFNKKYPADFLVFPRPQKIPVWHLVGGKELLHASELDGSEPNDGYPVLLEDWIRRDGLKCLKVKLRGNDAAWDFQRMIEIGRIAQQHDVSWLSTDFNCTVTEPDYVNEILDRLMREQPRISAMILYVEQPFPYELEKNQIDVRSVSARKPLFMDESAHDWRVIRLGRELGWTGVALKTCKTQTGALLSLCWAKAHGMTLMVQDLTNPMLAQIPHVLLAAHAGTIMGVETNAMQFYPEASSAEAKVHPGIYQRRNGEIDLRTVRGPGFGYRLDEMNRQLPAAEVSKI